MRSAEETPPPVLHAADGRPWDLQAFAGQPIVLAVLDDGLTTWPADLAQARAELRGLGAVLLLISRRGLWCFSPDDELEMFAAPETLPHAELAALRAWLGPPQTTDAI